MDPASSLGRVVVEETDRLVAVERVESHIANDHFPSITGAVDQDALPLRSTIKLSPDSSCQSKSPKHNHEQDRVDHDYRARIARERRRRAANHIHDSGTRPHGPDDVQQIPDTRITPQACVEAERREHGHSDRDDPGDPSDEDEEVIGIDLAVKPQPECRVVHRHQQRHVKNDN